MTDAGMGEGTRVALERRFAVDAPLARAWDVLADVVHWPEWAQHIRRVDVEPIAPLGPSSSGALRLRGGMRATFRMAIWDPPTRWVWVGRAGGLTIHYDHRFEEGAAGSTTMIWMVGLSGPGSRVLRRPFAFFYGRNVDRAIPRLRAVIERRASGDEK